MNITTCVLVCVLNLLASSAIANEQIANCFEEHGYIINVHTVNEINWSKVASCNAGYLIAKQKEQQEEFRDFLKHNPRYRYPGQSLNRCWGKPRVMPFEKSRLSISDSGMSAEIWYKDELPAGCFENASWDNRND